MCLQPVGAPSCIGYEWNGERGGILHLLYDEALELVALFGQDTEVQFVVHLKNHAAAEAFPAHAAVHTYHGYLHDVGGTALYGRVDGIALGIASYHGIVAVDVGQGTTAVEAPAFAVLFFHQKAPPLP